MTASRGDASRGDAVTLGDASTPLTLYAGKNLALIGVVTSPGVTLGELTNRIDGSPQTELGYPEVTRTVEYSKVRTVEYSKVLPEVSTVTGKESRGTSPEISFFGGYQP